jgi:hypothetical protein
MKEKHRRSMRDDLAKDKRLTTIMASVQIAMVLLISVILNMRIEHPVTSLLLATVIWALVLYNTPVFNWCFVIVKPNWAIILGNQAVYDSIEDDPNERIKMSDLRSLREVGPGIRGKLPWEVPFESVDLRSEVIIGNVDRLFECYTIDQIGLEITWQMVLTPMRGCLTNLVRKNEDAVRAYFTGAFEQALMGWVRKKTEKEVFELLHGLKGEIENLFGGQETVTDEEMDYGISTNTPQITRITRSKKYQQAAEGTAVAEHMGKIINSLKKELTEADPNVILAAAAAITGNKVSGILLMPGVTGGAKETGATIGAAMSTGKKATEKQKEG